MWNPLDWFFNRHTTKSYLESLLVQREMIESYHQLQIAAIDAQIEGLIKRISTNPNAVLGENDCEKSPVGTCVTDRNDPDHKCLFCG